MTVIEKMNTTNKKIPGILPPPPKNENDGKIENLSTKSISELMDIRDRQRKLLNNKAFLSKLTDKGAKIQAFYDKIVLNIKAKQQVEQACRLFSDLTLGTVDKDFVQSVEWEGKLERHRNTYLDSDDDSEPEDVLHILSQNTCEKKVIVLSPEKALINSEDLISIGEVPHIKKIVEKTEVNMQAKPVCQFKPYKTTVSDVHDPSKEILRKRNETWEVTAATPPPIVHSPAKILSLEESLHLQKEYNKHLKEVEMKHAAEKLLAQTGIKLPQMPGNTSKFRNYNCGDSDDTRSESDLEGSDKEVLDEEPERGGVVFTVMK